MHIRFVPRQKNINIIFLSNKQIYYKIVMLLCNKAWNLQYYNILLSIFIKILTSRNTPIVIHSKFENADQTILSHWIKIKP